MATCIIGTGAKLLLGSGPTQFVGQITNINWSGIERESVECTHMQSTGGREFIPTTLPDPGTVEIEVNYDADDAPTITGAPEQLIVEFPKKSSGSANGAQWSVASAFLLSASVAVPLEDKVSSTMTFKCSGAITFTDEV